MLLNYAASIASLIGLAVTIVTFCKLRKTSVAVDEAKQKVIEQTDKLLRHERLSELDVIISEAAQIKQKSLEIQVFLYMRLRHSLIRFRGLYPKLEKKQKKVLTDCIAILSSMEKENMATNDILSAHIDRLVSLASDLRKNLGGDE